MDNTFVPLIASAPTVRPAAFASLAGNAAAPAVAGNRAANSSTAAQDTVAMVSGHKAGCARPQITVMRDGERITRIQIQCSCNEIIQLECQ